MKSFHLRQICLTVVLVVLTLSAVGCTDEFYLSEKEASAYAGVLATESSANLHFDSLQNRLISLQFDNSSGPRLQSTNLLAEMRRTELAQLETGLAAVSLARLNTELEKQIGNWIDGRLLLYTSSSNDRAQLTELRSVTVEFLNNPTFAYHPERQSIEFNVRLHITINGTIEVNAVADLLDFVLGLFGSGINGTYPLRIEIDDLRLQGEASLLSPSASAGRVRFQLTPELGVLPGPLPIPLLRVLEDGVAVPDEVQVGVGEVLRKNLSSHVDEVFDQEYHNFALPHLGLSPTTAQTQSRLEMIYRPKAGPYGPESTNPTLHVVTRASDGKLYHGRKGDGGWSTYSAVPIPTPSPSPGGTGTPPIINNDPALFYSGSGQMELAATSANGNLVYAHWRDEAWGNFQTIGPNTTYTPSIRYRGKPAVIASAPGQAEIIAAGSDGNLWHLRRLNGVWWAPAAIPLSGYPFIAAPYRDPVAVHVGNKIVLIFADSQNRLAAIAFDLEVGLWGQATPFQNSAFASITIAHAPAAVASGDDRVDVVYVNPTGTPIHRVLKIRADNFVSLATGISFSGNETVINVAFKFNATPVLVASGYRQLDLIGRVFGNQLRHSRYVNASAPFQVDGRTVNPGWQSQMNMNGNLSAAGRMTSEQVTEFAAAATPTGRVEVAARCFGFPIVSLELFHNSFEGNRYGTAAWKSVHWRGYEATGYQSAEGRPALVATDRNFQIGAIGIGGLGVPAINHARMSASNATNFFLGPNARAALFMPDPLVLSSGPSLVDYIYIRDDGRLQHFRKTSDFTTQSYTPTVPNGVSLFGALTADSYGNGFIELAATGSDGCIYHWRFRSGAWTNPTGVACRITSAPALVYTGAGQLELLAVDSDYKLFRWRYLGTGWAPRLSVPSDFRINPELFGQTAVSSWGDATVDVAVVGLDTRALYHRRVGPDNEICTSTFPFVCPAPRGFSNLGGLVEEKPVLTAFSPTNLNALTMRGLLWYSNWARAEILQPVSFPPRRDPLIRWSGFQYIGGSEMVIGGAANTGPKNYAAAAIHLDGRIFINRYQDGRWTGFQPIVGQRPWMVLRSPVILPTITAHGG